MRSSLRFSAFLLIFASSVAIYVVHTKHPSEDRQSVPHFLVNGELIGEVEMMAGLDHYREAYLNQMAAGEKPTPNAYFETYKKWVIENEQVLGNDFSSHKAWREVFPNKNLSPIFNTRSHIITLRKITTIIARFGPFINIVIGILIIITKDAKSSPLSSSHSLQK
jgi:hypothetical protein